MTEIRKLEGFRKGLAGLLIGASLTFGGCKPPPIVELKKPEPFIVKVTDRWYYTYSKSVGYSGMPNSDTFCLFYHVDPSVPYYYPVEDNEIYFHGGKLKVLYVNPKEIKLEYLGEEK